MSRQISARLAMSGSFSPLVHRESVVFATPSLLAKAFWDSPVPATAAASRLANALLSGMARLSVPENGNVAQAP